MGRHRSKIKQGLGSGAPMAPLARHRQGDPPPPPLPLHKRAGRAGRRGLFGLWVVLSVVALTSVAALIVLAVTGLPVTAPDWLRARVEARINDELPAGAIEISELSVMIGAGLEPTLKIEGLSLADAAGTPAARLSQMRVALALVPLAQGEMRPSMLEVSELDLKLRRAANGEFDLAFALPGADLDQTGSVADILDAVDAVLQQPALAALETIEAAHVTLSFEDARAGRDWLLQDGALRLTQDAANVDIGLNFNLHYGSEAPAVAAFNFRSAKGSPVASFGASITDIAARDLGSQVPALAWMVALDAPISGALRAGIDETGQLDRMSGALEIGAGALSPGETTTPVRFDAGRAYFSFDPAAGKITFDEVSVRSEAGRITAEGRGYLRDLTADGWPQTMLGQFQVTEFHANPGGLFESAVEFSGGAADLRLRLDPFALTIGQAVLFEEERRYALSGEVREEAEGWAVALDGSIDAIDHARIVELWPVQMVPNTRQWLQQNLLTGQVRNVRGALRLRPEQEPRVSLTYEYSDARVRFIKTLPPITQASGHASIQGATYSMAIEKGIVAAPTGGQIDTSGSVFAIPDITTSPPQAVVRLKARGPLPAALALLDEPPFEFLSKAGQPVDLAEGRAEAEAEIHLPLAKDLSVDDVTFDVTGQLRDVRSEKLIEGRVLSAPELAVRVNGEGIEISGSGRLGKLPARAIWVQQFGPDYKGRSRLEGTVELSQRFVDEFGIGLPKGSVRGTGLARIELDFIRGAPARFQLVSDLNRLSLRLSDLGWSKPQNAKGRLAISGLLGTPPAIQALEIDAAGLKASGQIVLNANGTLKTASFSRVRVGGWLDAPVTLSGRGRNATPAVTVRGGSIDIRKTALGGSGGSGASGPLTLALDRLIVSDGIVFTGFRGSFAAQPAFNGSFTARVNGKAPIRGALAPGRSGTAIRILSDDAGAVFRAAGILEGARLGTMDLILNPRPGENGGYDGRLTGENVRVRGAPALADLLSAISVIGLLEQLNGQGLYFGSYEARFRLTPDAVVVTRGSAVGPSLGISMDGVYYLASKRMDMQGVISPLYLVNAIGQIFTRKGEGLFGFNFRLTGPSSNPRVQVNPLSILTPGMFREIFRRPPPKVSQ